MIGAAQPAVGGDGSFAAEPVELEARSARIVAPIVMKMLPGIQSVVEVGWGAGIWLAQFRRAGVPHILGAGPRRLEHHYTELSQQEYRSIDLETEIDVGEVFDLCLCLELAQCLPDTAAPSLVRSLCRLSDVVLFSAAIPGQGGQGHINEQWPSYWADLFQSAGYEVLDVVRGCIWNDARVSWQYRQNMLLFANSAGRARVAAGADAEGNASDPRSRPLDFVHPACFELYRSLAATIGSRQASADGALRPTYWQRRKAKLLRSIRKRQAIAMPAAEPRADAGIMAGRSFWQRRKVKLLGNLARLLAP